MTNEEAKISLYSEVPVKYLDIEFNKIISLVYSKLGDSFISSAEVLDKSNCLYRVPVKRLEIISSTNDNIKKDEEIDKRLFELDLKFENIILSCAAKRFEDASSYLYDLIEQAVKFSNYLEEKIKDINKEKDNKEVNNVQ